MDFAMGGMPQAEGTAEAETDFGAFQPGEMPSGGGMPARGSGGMPPGGGGGFQMDDSGSVLMGGAMGTPDPNAQNAFSLVGSQVNPMLLRGLISVLETKVQASQ
jgi:hypothetical protein